MLRLFRSKKHERPVSDAAGHEKPLPQLPPTRQVSAPTRRYNRTPPLPPAPKAAQQEGFYHLGSHSDDNLAPQEGRGAERAHHSDVDLPAEDSGARRDSLSRSVSKVAEAARETTTKKKKEQTPMSKDEEVLQLGIRHHEEGKLEEATEYFKQAAALGNPNGMFLYGISLRHGWGCQPDPGLAFQYLQKAAESAVFDLNALQPNAPQDTPGNSSEADVPQNAAARSELVLAIYELGVCFRHGWGVPKNKSTAAYYFEIAANLGDPDAQSDLGFCYLNGEGVRKDKKKAARYYRMASAQGVTVPGNSWIFKKKYEE